MVYRKGFTEIANLDGYLINKKGEVFSMKSNKTLRVTDGVVEVYVGGIKKKINVAHLVLETFKGNPHGAKRVNYKNGDKSDTSLSNLEWSIPATKTTKTSKTAMVTPAAGNTSSSSQEIFDEIKRLKKQLTMLQKKKDALAKSNSVATLIKENLATIVEGLAKGEKISTLTKRVVGKVLSREVLSNHLTKNCGVSLADLVSIAKLYKAKPDYVKSIVKLYNGKMSNVVFSK
jgi:regulator of replication initiation timing